MKKMYLNEEDEEKTQKMNFHHTIMSEKVAIGYKETEQNSLTV